MDYPRPSVASAVYTGFPPLVPAPALTLRQPFSPRFLTSRPSLVKWGRKENGERKMKKPRLVSYLPFGHFPFFKRRDDPLKKPHAKPPRRKARKEASLCAFAPLRETKFVFHFFCFWFYDPAAPAALGQLLRGGLAVECTLNPSLPVIFRIDDAPQNSASHLSS
jgi:hypothetical protein